MVIDGYKDDYIIDKMNDHIIPGRASYTTPATLYAGLASTVPNKTRGVTELPATGGYARVALASAFLSASVAGYQTNLVAITFPTPSVNWIEANSVIIYEASTGNNKFWVVRILPRIAVAGIPIVIPIGALQLSSS